jgi:hypothetical protein
MPIRDDRLLPCPFCGATPDFWVGPNTGWTAECTGCRIKLSPFWLNGEKADRETAIAYWNRRIPTEPSP